MKLHIPFIASLLIIMLSLNHCNSSKSLPGQGNEEAGEMVSGKIVDMTGMGTCSWVIELETGDKIEPVNLQDFDVEVADGKQVSLSYEKMPDMASGCMVGDIVRIRKMVEK